MKLTCDSEWMKKSISTNLCVHKFAGVCLGSRLVFELLQISEDAKVLWIANTSGCNIQGDIEMSTAICLGAVPIIQNEQYTKATSLIKNNH